MRAEGQQRLLAVRVVDDVEFVRRSSQITGACCRDCISNPLSYDELADEDGRGDEADGEDGDEGAPAALWDLGVELVVCAARCSGAPLHAPSCGSVTAIVGGGQRVNAALCAGQFRGSVRCACVGANGRTAVISQSAPRGVPESAEPLRRDSTFTGCGSGRRSGRAPRRRSAIRRRRQSCRRGRPPNRRASARSPRRCCPRGRRLGRPASAHEAARPTTTASSAATRPRRPTILRGGHARPARLAHAPRSGRGAAKWEARALSPRGDGSARRAPRRHLRRLGGAGAASRASTIGGWRRCDGGGAAVARPSRVWPRRADAEAAHAAEEEEGRVTREADAAREQRSELHATLEQMSERRRRDPAYAFTPHSSPRAPPRRRAAAGAAARRRRRRRAARRRAARSSSVSYPCPAAPPASWGSFAPARSDSPPPPPDATLPRRADPRRSARRGPSSTSNSTASPTPRRRRARRGGARRPSSR